MKYNVIGYHESNPAISFLVKSFDTEKEAEVCRSMIFERYTYNGQTYWKFVIQSV